MCIVYTNNRRQYIREKMANISAKFSDTGKFLYPPRHVIYRPTPHYRPSIVEHDTLVGNIADIYVGLRYKCIYSCSRR